jgi:hypothetical protein
MPVGGEPEPTDTTYRDARYLGTSEDDEEEVQDLGFIVEDRRDQRIMLTDGWQRLDDLDTDESLASNRQGAIPGADQLRAQGAPGEWFATDYRVDHAVGEAQEADFVATSMVESDPETNAGMDDATDESFDQLDGNPRRTNLLGRAPGVVAGLGSSLPQDLGKGAPR